MKTEDFLKKIKAEFDRNYEIIVSKNADYAGDKDALANFRAGEQFGLDTKIGILYRILDKYNRIANLLTTGKDPKVESEKVSDTLSDMANYCMILKVIVDHDNEDL